MRYIPVLQLKQGMTLGQDIYNGKGRLLLAKDLILNDEYITNIERLGIPGIYIEDEFSKDIEIKTILRPAIKRDAVKLIRDLFVVEKDDFVTQKELQEIVISVVQDVMNNDDVMHNMIDLRNYDDYTYYHSVNVSVLSTVMGAGLMMSREELNQLATSAILHDVGKRFFDLEILNAKRKLTPEEMEIVKQHPKLGYDYLMKNYNFSSDVCLSVLQHHEFYNGQGYPYEKAGNEISIHARIIKIADVYDALVSKRPYHYPVSPSEAVEYIMGRSGMEFDPKIVSAFLRKVAVYPVGCEVILSDGNQGVVVENYSDNILRPIVKVLGSNSIIDLNMDSTARNITILNLVV